LFKNILVISWLSTPTLRRREKILEHQSRILLDTILQYRIQYRYNTEYCWTTSYSIGYNTGYCWTPSYNIGYNTGYNTGYRVQYRIQGTIQETAGHNPTI